MSLSSTLPAPIQRSFVWFAGDHFTPPPCETGINGNWYVDPETGLQTMLVGGIALAKTDLVAGGMVYLVPQSEDQAVDGLYLPGNFTKIFFVVPMSSPMMPSGAQGWWAELQAGGALVEDEGDGMIPTYHLPQMAVATDGHLALSIVSSGGQIPSEYLGQLSSGGVEDKALLETTTIMVVQVNPGNAVAWIARCDRDSWVWTARM